MDIYVLIESDTKEIRYVGQTRQTLSTRLYGHLYHKRLVKNTWKNNWIKCVLTRGATVLIQSVQQLYTQKDLDEAERYWIQHFRDRGCRLTNQAAGGWGGGMLGKNHSEETRLKMSVTAKKIKHKSPSEETRLRMSEAAKRSNVGRFLAPYIGQRKGIKHTDEAKAKMSAAKTGRRNHLRCGATDQEIIDLYVGGTTALQISKLLHVDTGRALGVLRSAGIPIRGGHHKKD